MQFANKVVPIRAVPKDSAKAAEERRRFARIQEKGLLARGFDQATVSQILKAAGPRRCLEAIDWAYRAREDVRQIFVEDTPSYEAAGDALRMVLIGISRTRMNRKRIEKALDAIGVEPPSDERLHVFTRILAGAQVALEVGLP